MGIAERVYELVQGLPENSARQVLEFVKGKCHEQREVYIKLDLGNDEGAPKNQQDPRPHNLTRSVRGSGCSPIFPGMPVS